ncbi:TetR family transcriptional regulator [Flexivirga oryzae]|uniref:AcrR family transcriptional regulator n=1 Tax=Flexivirga oryzae TaxID=1794944 RepID=A0A839N4Q5_9MICO|nr:AcrR family transcriptional regulator [Flexivirga oryzae]
MPHVPTEVRRQQFIDAAITVIARDGVDGATTRRIADEAAAPLATLHYCFQTKENLLWAVFQSLADTVRINVEKVTGPGQATAAIATRLLAEAVRWGIDNPAATRAQIEILLWAERNDRAFAVRVYDMFIDSWKGYLAGARTPLPDEELETVTRMIVAMLDGLSLQLFTHGDTERALREAATAEAMLTAYLRRRRR